MEIVAVGLAALSSTIGGLCLLVLNSMATDIREIRAQGAQNDSDIAVLMQGCKKAGILT